MEITEFDGEYDFLSNFFLHPVEFEGKVYPSNEHAFQAAKSLDTAVREQIRKAKSPGEAKRLGRKLTPRLHWDNARLRVMHTILVAKFSDPVLRQKLRDTGDARLVEGNTWNDTFWGVCNGSGKNHLGRLLMEIRSEI